VDNLAAWTPCSLAHTPFSLIHPVWGNFLLLFVIVEGVGQWPSKGTSFMVSADDIIGFPVSFLFHDPRTHLPDAFLIYLYYLLFKLFNSRLSYDAVCLKMEYPALWDSKEGISTTVLCVVFEVLAIVATVLRIWSRREKRMTLVLNDFAAIIALAAVLGSIWKKMN
jgi:hypothetical protein